MAQAFARFGTRVTLLDAAGQVLPREDADAAAIVSARLAADGVSVLVGTAAVAVRHGDRGFAIDHARGGLTADALLVAAGRTPRVSALGLETAGVDYGLEGVVVNDHLRTTNRRIYAAGDVCSRHKFTHAADALARIVVQNALFFGRRRVSRLVVPWCTFTSPEVAHVGLTLTEAEKRGADTITIPLSSVDRAVVDEATSGFVRLHHEGGRIVGATIVSPAAGELIGAVAMAMQSGQSLGDLASVIFPYPTLSIALRQAGDAYRRSRLTPFVRTALRYYFHASS